MDSQPLNLYYIPFTTATSLRILPHSVIIEGFLLAKRINRGTFLLSCKAIKKNTKGILERRETKPAQSQAVCLLPFAEQRQGGNSNGCYKEGGRTRKYP
ncbi:MAG: hypothetical protein D3910_10130 [Candidatus Electrothrix sp. ATG2]|nr:hypothetical protein [Candidatus Electrothrix sp. ATG2]